MNQVDPNTSYLKQHQFGMDRTINDDFPASLPSTGWIPAAAQVREERREHGHQVDPTCGPNREGGAVSRSGTVLAADWNWTTSPGTRNHWFKSSEHRFCSDCPHRLESMAAPLGDIKGRGKDRDWGSRVNDELREAVLRVGRREQN